MVINAPVDDEKCGHLYDIICVNRYPAWYSDPGHLEVIHDSIKVDLEKWYQKYGKPVILTEFGADTIAGFHTLPPQMFSEEFQVEYLRKVCETLDELDFVIGEHVWNLADFMTKQGTTRIIGNRKGVFSRDRQPKMAAHYLKERWTGKRK